jgi:hypothetical protein
MTMTPYEFGQQLGGRMKSAGVLDNASTLGSQMWNNGARTFKGMTGAVGAGLGAAGAGIGAGGMLIGNAAGSLVGQQPFSNEAVNTVAGTAGNYANVARGYGQDLANSLGLGAQGLAGTHQAGSAGDAAWKTVEQQPGVSQGARDFSDRAFNIVDTAATIAPAAAIGGVGQVLKPLQATQAAAGAAARVPTTLKPVMNAANTAQKAYGTTNNAASAAKLIGSGMATPQ